MMLDWATFVACSRPAAHKCFVEWVFRHQPVSHAPIIWAILKPLPRRCLVVPLQIFVVY